MWIEGSKTYALRSFEGSQSWAEDGTPPPEVGVISKNLEFFPGGLRSRRGFSTLFNSPAGVFNGRYWRQGQAGGKVHSLLYARGAGPLVIHRNLSTGVETVLLAGSQVTAMRFCHFAPWGKHVFMFPVPSIDFNTSLTGWVWDGDPINSPNIMFHAPATTSEVTISSVVSGTEQTTPGFHYFGFVAITKEGYVTRPCPTLGGTWQPGVASVSINQEAVQLIADPVTTWPSWIDSIHFIFSTSRLSSTNYEAHEFFLVPGARYQVSGSSNVTHTINYSDAVLRSAGESAEDLFFLLAQSNSGTSIFPKFGGSWGDRFFLILNYGGVDSLFISEPGLPQTMTITRHRRELPDGLSINAAYPYDASLLIVGDSWTFIQADGGGDKPVLWPKSLQVSGTIGSPSPFGVAVESVPSSQFSKTYANYAIIAHPSGLWKLEGSRYLDLPLSLHQPKEWADIDWSHPEEVQTVLWPEQKLILVRYQSLTDSIIRFMVWSFQNGWAPSKLKFTIWDFNIPTNIYIPGLAIIGTHPTSQLTELWLPPIIAPGSTGPVLRSLSHSSGDAMWYGENLGGAEYGIAPKWRSGAFPPGNKSSNIDWLAVEASIRGAGDLLISALSKDFLRSSSLPTIPLAASSNFNLLRGLGLRSPELYIDISLSSPSYGDFFSLTGLKTYHTPIEEAL